MPLSSHLLRGLPGQKRGGRDAPSGAFWGSIFLSHTTAHDNQCFGPVLMGWYNFGRYLQQNMVGLFFTEGQLLRPKMEPFPSYPISPAHAAK